MIILFSIIAIIIWAVSFAIRQKKPKEGKILSWVAIIILAILIIIKLV